MSAALRDAASDPGAVLERVRAPFSADTVEVDRVVVIDDDHAMRISCRQILERMGFTVDVFEDGAQGLEGVARLKPGLAVVDLKMPGLSGLDVIGRIHRIDPTIVLIVITGYATIGTAVEAMKSGAYDFLPKPFAPDELRVIVHRGLERRRLQRLAQQLEVERELMHRRFVSFVSHQLQTPLVAVHQYLDVLSRMGDRPEANERRQEWLDRCLRRTEELQALIRDWLTLARVENGALVADRSVIDVRQLLPAVVESCQALAHEHDVTVHVAVPPVVCPIAGDRSALAVLAENLITNAIKYNRPDGSVTVALECGDGEVVLTVRDTGIGIPERYRAAVFDEFVRVRGEAVKRSGSGLGLPICRRIAAELGAVIELESDEGVGSTFRVRLPQFRGSEARGGVT